MNFPGGLPDLPGYFEPIRLPEPPGGFPPDPLDFPAPPRDKKPSRRTRRRSSGGQEHPPARWRSAASLTRAAVLTMGVTLLAVAALVLFIALERL
jgi:hypothetical protein